jgi:hypothetical protein
MTQWRTAIDANVLIAAYRADQPASRAEGEGSGLLSAQTVRRRR